MVQSGYVNTIMDMEMMVMKVSVCDVCGAPFKSYKKMFYCSEECQNYADTSFSNLMGKLNSMINAEVAARLTKVMTGDEHSIKCEHNGLVYSFSSLNKCDEFLAVQLHWPVDVCKYHLRQRQPLIENWRISYEQ